MPNNKRPWKILFPEMGTLKDQGKCPTCKETIVLASFKDELSVKEFSISGMCQKCQDSVFGE